MAALTITTSTNKDSTTGRLNGESVTVNGGQFLIDSDSRWAQDSQVFGNLNFSSSQAGSVKIDATQTWQIPFTRVSGNVPSIAPLGSNAVTGAVSGATGELLRVWASGNKTPLAPGAPIPASGWIKLRSKTGEFAIDENIVLPGGATIKATTGGQRSWIHFVVANSATIRPTRTCGFIVDGDWFELGLTTGLTNQQIEYPVADSCPAVQIETAPGSGVYEWWLNAGNRWGSATKYVSVDERGRYFGCTAAGLITFNLTGANECGKLPAANCRIRIPNIIVSNAVSTNWAQNSLTATKPVVSTLSQGQSNIGFLCGPITLNFTNFDRIALKNSAFFSAIVCNNVNKPIEFENLAIGLHDAIDAVALTLSNQFQGGSFKNLCFARYSSVAASSGTFIGTDVRGATFENCEFRIFSSLTAVTRGSPTSNTMFFTRTYNSVVDGIKIIGARISLINCEYVKIKNVEYADCHIGETQTTNAQSAIDFSQSTNCYVDGIAAYAGISNAHPYNSIINFTNARRSDFRNIGTPLQPYDCGTTNACGYIASVSVVSGANFSRIYTSNTRLGVMQASSNCVDISLINVQGDYADSGTADAKNLTIKGSRWASTILTRNGNTDKIWEDGFSSETAGYITAAANEPFDLQKSKVELTGLAQYDAVGNIYLTSIGDSVTLTQNYYSLGHESLDSFTFVGVNSTFIALSFQFDTGLGFNGTWLTINNTNLRSVVIDPSVGVALKIKCECVAASANNRVSFVRINTTTSLVSQQIQYPALPEPAEEGAKQQDFVLRISNIISGSKAIIFTTSDEVDLASFDNISNGFIEYNYSYTSAVPITVVVHHENYKEVRFDTLLTESDNNIPIIQKLDPISLE